MTQPPTEAPAVDAVGTNGKGLIDFVPLSDDAHLKKKILREGTGDHVPKGANVEVHYVGTLYPSGEKFDASRDRDAPFTFRLGQGQVIKGWDVGVASMRVGELAELLCESDYAYGERGSPPTIPANATLKFEVEVLGFEEVAESPAQHWAAAKKKKEEGTVAFKAGNYAVAKSAYAKAVDHVDQAGGAEGLSEDDAKTLRVATMGNLSMCCLKVGENKEAAKWSEKVLKEDPLNIKASYRLGQAYLALSDHDASVRALEAGIRAAGSDTKDLTTLLAHVQRAKAESEKKEKSMYKNMFK